MTTNQHIPQAPQQATPVEATVPNYLRELLYRAADQLSARWPEVSVEFPWWSAGEECRYTARMEWRFCMQGPRVSVFDSRSGQFVCQSLEGLPYEIDPEAWSIDAPSDEIDKYMWEQRKKYKDRRQ